MKNAGGFCVSTNPTQKVTRVKLLFNLQNADWSPGIVHLLSMFQRLRKNNQHWPKRAREGLCPARGNACESVSTPQKSLTWLQYGTNPERQRKNLTTPLYYKMTWKIVQNPWLAIETSSGIQVHSQGHTDVFLSWQLDTAVAETNHQLLLG